MWAQEMLQVSFELTAAHPSAAEDHSCWDKEGWSSTSWGFRLPSLRCLQRHVLGVSKGLCAFQNVDTQRNLVQGVPPLGQVVKEGWLDTFSTCRRLGTALYCHMGGQRRCLELFPAPLLLSQWGPTPLQGRESHPLG